MTTSSYDKTAALVVLPAVAGGRLRDSSLRSWLARGDLVQLEPPANLLASLLAEMGQALPEQGLAALRLWGQTGDRPAGWMAAADPVYLEPRLDHLCLYAQPPGALRPSELGALIDHLQARLGDDGGCGFARVGSYGYLSCQRPLATARVSPQEIHGQVPKEFMPDGDGADRQRQLLSEIEMALHEHEVNLERQAQNRQPVNSLWLWGGGVAPPQETVPQPPLFADDPLLTGYWRSKTALAEAWPGSLAACLEVAVSGLVAVVPDEVDDVSEVLAELRSALQSGRLESLVLLFRDGVRAELRHADRFRVWRRRNTLLESPRA